MSTYPEGGNRSRGGQRGNARGVDRGRGSRGDNKTRGTPEYRGGTYG